MLLLWPQGRSLTPQGVSSGWRLRSVMWQMIQSITLKKSKAPIKTLDTKAYLSFLAGEHIRVPGQWVGPPMPPHSNERAQELCTWEHTDLTHCILSGADFYPWQRSPRFLALGTGLMEDNFPMGQGEGGWFQDNLRALHLLCPLSLLLLHQLHFRWSGIRSWRLGTPAL